MQKHFFTFNKQNYLIILAGVALVVIGFLMMTGGGTDDPNVFNGKELFSERRITVAPITVILGYVVVIFGIMKKPKETNQDSGPKAAN